MDPTVAFIIGVAIGAILMAVGIFIGGGVVMAMRPNADKKEQKIL